MASAIQKVAMNHYLTIVPDASVQEAVERMKLAADDAIVVNQMGHIVGIFTEHDLFEKVVSQKRDPKQTTVGEVMSAMPLTAPDTIDEGQALRLIHEAHRTHLVLLNKLNQVVGVISANDILEENLTKLQTENKDLANYLMADAPGG